MSANIEIPDRLPGDDHAKLAALSGFRYHEQAIWFLNGFWETHETHAELMWNWVQQIAKLDLQNGANGTGVDEMNAHRFLENFHETMTYVFSPSFYFILCFFYSHFFLLYFHSLY